MMMQHRVLLEFPRKHHLISTGGSDCHQKPIIMGSVKVPQKCYAIPTLKPT